MNKIKNITQWINRIFNQEKMKIYIIIITMKIKTMHIIQMIHLLKSMTKRQFLMDLKENLKIQVIVQKDMIFINQISVHI